ncbi:MAG: glucose 1-dehydrogenase [Chthoniobacterales bacterium]
MKSLPFRLDEKVAVVTGAARGLGRAVAKLLADQGAKVAMVDKNNEEISIAAQEIGEAAIAYSADLEKVDDLPALVKRIHSEQGRIDILVNNAGICPRLAFTESTPENWETLMNVNARSQYFMMRAVHPIMKAQGHGRIINVTSTGGRIGSLANASIYSGTKGAIAMFTKSVAREVAADGILVNCVAPGMMDTDLMRNLPKERIDALCDQIPLKRIGSTEEVASIFAFLASDECSYITGSTFDVNGGWLML